MLLPNISHVSAANTYRGCRDGETVEAYIARLAAELDAEFRRLGPDTVCAFVAEPVVGAVSVPYLFVTLGRYIGASTC
jgi:adenosylmethionine-8-amino-7-oxononanoate aminotransferase